MQHRYLTFTLSLLCVYSALMARPHSSFSSQDKTRTLQRHAPANTAGGNSNGGFIIVRTEAGTECRPVAAHEAEGLDLTERRVALMALGTTTLPRATQQQGLKITLRGTQQLDSFPQAKQAFQRAAAKWESIVRSNITIVLDVDFGPTRFGVPYPSPNIIGSTDAQQLNDASATGYADIRQGLLATAQTAAQTAVFNLLPATTLPTDLGNTNFSGAASANYRALGLLAAVADPDRESQFGPPPSIGFNSAFTYDFDPSDGIDADKLDFEAAALHEIGHVLGFLSFAGTKELAVTAPLFPTPWDLFRFRPGGLTLNTLATRPRVQLTGGEQVFFAGGDELALSTGGLLGNLGDGRQSSHWRDDVFTGQYVGVMDPSGSSGERNDITAADLTALSHFGYRINPDARVFELLTVSDGTREQAQDRTNALVVNRYTPSRYPAKLEFFRLQIPPPPDGLAQTGQTMRIFGFADPNRTGQPPVNPTLLFERTVTLDQLAANRVLHIQIPNGPTINSGDLYVGVQTASSAIPIAVDLTRPQNRSFISANNGLNFQALTATGTTPVSANFIAQAYLSMTYGTTPAPTGVTLSPTAIAPGSVAFTLFVFGGNFQTNSIVRVNGNDRPTTYLSATQLQAQIPASDVANVGTAKVTVFTPGPGGGETLPANLSIASNNPAPSLTQLDPPGSPVGVSSIVLNVFGANFTAQSRVRVNGNERATSFVNSTQLTTTLSQADLAAAAQLNITVFTPTPGGGLSNALSFAVSTCSFTTSVSNNLQNLASNGATATALLNAGFLLNASATVCPWTATASETWISFTSPLSGTGKAVIAYSAQPNPSATPREARITVGNQTVTVRQLGRAAAVSAASYTPQAAPDSIISLFGAGLAKANRSATTTPLPTNLNGTTVLLLDARGQQHSVGLFFVSAGQINLLLPANAALGNAELIVIVDGQFQSYVRLPLTAVAPAFFTANSSGLGVPAAVLVRTKPDNSQTFEAVAELNTTTRRFVPRTIDFGAETDKLTLVLFGTGVRGRSGLGAIALQIAGLDVPVQYAGPQGVLIGADQLNLDLPRALRGRGEVTLNGTVDGRAVNAVTLSFR